MVAVDLLTRKALRDLRATWAQTLALVAVLALGVTAFVAAVGAYRDLGASEARTFTRLNFADAWFGLEPGADTLAAETARRPAIAEAEGRLIIDTGMPIAGGDRVRARLVGAGRDAAVNRVLVVDGHELREPGEVLVERHFAERRGIRPGDTIAPVVAGRPMPLQVAGTVASAEYLQVTPDRYELLPAPSSFAVLFVDLAELQDASAQPGMINELAVRLDADADRRTMVDLETALRDRGILRETVRRADQASYAALQQDLAAFRAIAFAIPTLILLAGVVSVAVMLGRMVRTQRPLIGIMKAVGYSDRAVLRHYVTFALTIGVVGAIVGVVAGTALGRVITRGYASELGIPFTVPHFHPALALLALGATMAAVIVAGLRPALRSARIAPAVAARVDVADVGRATRGRIERVVPLSLAGRLSLRTLQRARGRAAATAAGILAAFVLVLMVLGLRDGIGLFLQRIDDLERWDVSATFAEPQPPTIADRVGGWPGVTNASPFLQLPAAVTNGDRREDVLVTALETEQDLRTFRLDAHTTPADALAPGHLVVTTGLAEALGVERGDAVTVLTPTGPAELEIGGTSDEPIPARAYVSFDTAAELADVDAPPVNGLYLSVDDAAAGEIRSRLYDLPNVEAVQVRDEQRTDLQSLLAIFNAVVAVMLAFAVAMAFAIVFNATTINVLEREREYGTMRAIGARPGVIGRLLANEATLLWTIALVPGLLLGTVVAQRLGDAVAADLFVLPIEITPFSYVVTAAGVLLVALVALLFPLRRVRRLDLASATKTLA